MVLCFVIIAGVVDSIAAFQAADWGLVPCQHSCLLQGGGHLSYINRVFV